METPSFFDAVLLMLSTGAAWTVVGILFGAAPPDRDRLRTFFALNALIFAAFVWTARAPEASPAGEVFRLAALMVPSAAAEVAAFLLLKRAMDLGPQGIAWSVAQSAMAVPFVCSVVFLRDPATAAQWTGLALLLASLVLFARDKPASGAAGDGARYLRLVFASFLLVGAGGFLRLVPGRAGFSEAALTWRLPLMAPVGAVFWTAVCVAGRNWAPGRVWKISLAYAAAVAFGQVCFFAAADAADALRITSVVMPVATGTCILLFALWCRFVRRERLSRAGWAAVALDLAGIALLSWRTTT